MSPRLYIFDADNTLRRTLLPDRPSPRAPSEWQLMPGVRETLGRIPWGADGPFLGVASNQDQVGYGLLAADTAEELLHAMVVEAVGTIAPPPCIRFCPHTAEQACACRKPAPGMLHGIMEHFEVTARETLFVGDSEFDALAARRAGVGFVPAGRFFSRDGISAAPAPPGAPDRRPGCRND